MQGFKRINDDVIEVDDVLLAHLNTSKGFNSYPTTLLNSPHPVYVFYNTFENGKAVPNNIPLEIGLQYNMRTGKFLNPSEFENIGYKIEGDNVIVTDPLLYYLTDSKLFYVHLSTNKRVIDKAYVEDALHNKYPLTKGLTYNRKTLTYTNTSPMRKLVPKKEVHSVYTKMGKDLRKIAKSFSNIGVYDATYLERNGTTFNSRFYLKNNRSDYIPHTHSPTTLMEAIENPTHINIALLTLYNYGSTYGVEQITYEMITFAINKAINAYRDTWLFANDGFTIEEM